MPTQYCQIANLRGRVTSAPAQTNDPAEKFAWVNCDLPGVTNPSFKVIGPNAWFDPGCSGVGVIHNGDRVVIGGRWRENQPQSGNVYHVLDATAPGFTVTDQNVAGDVVYVSDGYGKCTQAWQSEMSGYGYFLMEIDADPGEPKIALKVRMPTSQQGTAPALNAMVHVSGNLQVESGQLVLVDAGVI